MFKIARAGSGPGYLAVQRAVLWPLAGCTTRDGLSEESRWRSLAWKWRRRVEALSDAEAPWLITGKRGAYAWSCPPPACFLKVKSQSCGKPLVCPFCYARRYVLEAYKAVWRLGEIYGWPLQVSIDRQVVGYHNKTGDLAQTAGHIRARMRRYRRSYGKHGFQFLFPKEDYGMIALRRVGVYLRASGPGEQYWLKDNWAAAKLIGELCVIPRGFLRTQPEVALAFVKGFASAHLFRTYGASRLRALQAKRVLMKLRPGQLPREIGRIVWRGDAHTLADNYQENFEATND